MSAKPMLLTVLALAVLFVAGGATYTIKETEQVVITQFGRIFGEAVKDPGLHFKLPMVHDVHRFDKRWLDWDGDPNEIPTKDKKYIWIDTYARWRVTDPIQFYERLRDEASAQSRLDDIIDGEIRNVIANHALIEIVRSSDRNFEFGDEAQDRTMEQVAFVPELGREKLTRLVIEKVAAVVPGYGIEIADIKIKRVNYVESVQQKVFERMISERKRIAQRHRSEGQGKSAEISGRIERERLKIESEAYRKAEEVRGLADAEDRKSVV